MGIGLIVGVLIARHLGPEQFGLLNYAIAYVSMFGILAGLGLQNIVVRELVHCPEHTNEILCASFTLKLISAAISTAVALATIYLIQPNDTSTRIIVSILSISLLFKSTEVIRYWFESQVISRYIVWVENTVFAVLALVKIYLILSGYSLLAFILINLAEAALVALGLIFIFKRNGPVFKIKPPLVIRMRSLLRDSWPLLLAGLAVVVYMRIDIIMLQEMTSADEVGLYAAATKISEIWYFLPVIICSSLSPSLLKSAQESQRSFLEKLRKLYFSMTWLAVLLSLPISISAYPLIQMLYGADYQAAGSILAIHLWASIAVFLGTASSQFLLANNLQKISLYRTGVGVIANIGINLWLIPIYGATGAAIATVISYYISVFSMLLFKSCRQHTVFMATSIFRLKESALS